MTTSTAALIDRWSTYVQSLRLWLMELVVWLATATKWREFRLVAQQDLRELRSDIRLLLVTRIALEAQAGRFDPRRNFVRGKNPDIDLVLSRRRFMRCATRGVCLHTFADAKRVLDNMDVHVARCARNLRNGVGVKGLYWSVGEHVGVCAIGDARPEAPDTS